MDERLLNASINDLAAFLRGRFQMQGPWAADTGGRESEFPYDLPLALWKEADPSMRRNLVEATRALVEEVPGPGWSVEAVTWLVCFVDLAQMRELMDSLEQIALSGRWLKGTDDPASRHVVLLRTLLDMGWAGSPEFWLDLPEEVQRRYPAVGFRGLLANDMMDAAFGYLHELVRDREAARQIVNVLADVMDDADARREVHHQLGGWISQLPPDVVDEFQKWFRVHRWGEISAGPQRPRLLVAANRRRFGAVGLPEPQSAARPWTEDRSNGSSLRFASMTTV